MRLVVFACLLALCFPSAALASFEALLAAARTKDLAGVRTLLEQGADPDPPYDGYTGYTPLMFAAGNGDAEMTRLLLQADAETEHRDHNGERALEWATRAWYLHQSADVPGAVRLLLDAGSPADSDDDRFGISPLMNASQYGGEARLMRLLLGAGAEAGRLDDSGRAALHRAASKDGEGVGLLLAAGADPNVADASLGRTPLHEAAEGAAVVNVRLLLEAGALTEPRYYRGQTALFLAAAQGAADAVRLLVEAGAEIDARDEDGVTPLLATLAGEAAIDGRRAAAALLAKRTAEPERAFAALIDRGFDEAAEHLFDRGVDIDAPDFQARSPLAAAAGRADPRWFDRLLAAGADRRRHGGEALGAAASGGLDQRIRQLVALGTAVDAVDRHGATALLRAAASGNVGTVRTLVELGADRDPRDLRGAGPSDYMAAARMPLEEAIVRASESRAYIDVAAETAELERLLAAHQRIEDLLKE